MTPDARPCLRPPVIGDTLWRVDLSFGTAWIVCVL
jgi:hypothetical protein